MTLDVPTLEKVLSRAYASFGTLLKNGVHLNWGVRETALGAVKADDKTYLDLGPLELAKADPSLAALHWTLLDALARHSQSLSRTLGFSILACADLVNGPILRLSHYHGRRLQVVNHAHSDIDLLTFLPRASAPGLQLRRNGFWRKLKIGPDEVGVLIGDLAEEFGGPRPTSHRVVSDGSQRISASFFINARADLRVRDGSTVAEAMNRRLHEVRGHDDG